MCGVKTVDMKMRRDLMQMLDLKYTIGHLAKITSAVGMDMY